MPDQPAQVFWTPPPGGLPLSAGRPLFWGGQTGQLFGIHIVNLLLTIVTLGIFRFWAIVRVRRYVWSHTAFLGDRLEYTGTGGELLRGFLIVLAVLLPLLLTGTLLDLAGVIDPWILGAVWVLKLVVFLYLLSAGRHAARRYFASRTLWRGLRFAVSGSPWRCGAVQFGWWLATIGTLGIARPWAVAAEARWSLGRLHLGTLPFRFTGTGRQILGPWIVALVIGAVGVAFAAIVIASLATGDAGGAILNLGRGKQRMTPEQFTAARIGIVVVIGLLVVPLLAGPFLLFAWFTYAAAVMRWRWANLELGGARFAMPQVGAGRLMRLHVGNAVLMFFSFGLLYPVTVTRNSRFLAELLWTDRFPDVSAARQIEPGTLNAEGLANVLDGGGAGLGI